jgi:hypothetical protein
MEVGLTVIVAPAGVGVGVAVGAGVGVGGPGVAVGGGVPEEVRTRVTTTTVSGHPAAENVMFCVYVPAASPLVCGVNVVEEPGAPLVGWASNQGEVSKLCQVAPFVGVT